MADKGLYDIMRYPDRRLRKKCADIQEIGAEEEAEFERMYATMKANNGIGFAAPQAGIMKNMFVAEVDGEVLFLANPVILWSDGFGAIDEGCLSVPGVRVRVGRPQEIVAAGLTASGKKAEIGAKGLLATVIQHEMDHLKGRLIIDYMPVLERIKFSIRRRA